MYNHIKENLICSYNKNVEVREQEGISGWKIQEMNRFLSYQRQIEGLKLLDLGSGPGIQALLFQEKGIDVACIDISPKMVEACMKKGLQAYEMDFHSINFQNETFDAVWAMNSLLHVPKSELDVVLKNVQRILKPGGIFYLGVYGGYEFEGIWNGDSYNPKRFFSFYKDEQIKEKVSEFFEVLSFEVIEQGEESPCYQGLVVRKST